MSTTPNPYRSFRYPAEIINQAVWLYHWHRQVVEEGHTDGGSHPDLGDARDTSHLSPDLEGPSTSTAMIRGVGVGRTVEEIGNLIVS